MRYYIIHYYKRSDVEVINMLFNKPIHKYKCQRRERLIGTTLTPLEYADKRKIILVNFTEIDAANYELWYRNF